MIRVIYSFFLVPIIILIGLAACNNRQDIEVLVTRSQDSERKGDIESAVRLLDQAVSLDSSRAEVFILRGYSLGKLKNDRNAINDFTKAISLDSNIVMAFFLKGLAHSRLEEDSLAIICFNSAINLKTNKKIIFDDKVSTLSGSDLRRDIDLQVITYNRGVCFYQLGRDDEATKDFYYSINKGYMVGQSFAYLSEMSFDDNREKEGCIFLKKAIQAGYKDTANVFKTRCL